MKEARSENSLNGLQAARGMHDVLPDRAAPQAALEARAREVFGAYRFREIRTPVLEPAALFERAIGEATDIVEKEMFTLKDRGDRVLCLRPEGTAGIVRALIEHSLKATEPLLKFFYAGPMFRAERPQKGRYREFTQIGAENFGDPGPAADAEMIALACDLLKAFGLSGKRVWINSIGCPNCRPAYQKALRAFLEKERLELCEHCRRRMEKNPLRVLDCKPDGPRLEQAPQSSDFLCADCRGHFEAVLESLQAQEIPFEKHPRLVRGLDYYTRTVFEIYPAKESGSQDALAAGGRYDGLVELLGGEPTPAVGFALGVERALNALAESSPVPAPARAGAFIAVLGQAARPAALKILRDLRARRLPTEMGGPGQSLKSQMRLADRLGSRWCLLIGEDEVRAGRATVKNLETQEQTQVPMAEVAGALR